MNKYKIENIINTAICGEALEELKKIPDECINMVMTSPSYWSLRDYGVKGQLGLEENFQTYIKRLCDIFDEVKRVLKKDGTCWVNLGDTYNGSGGSHKNYMKNDTGFQGKYRRTAQPTRADMPNKCLCQIPSRFSLEMCNRGWILRNSIIWHKPNCMPSSVKDRFTVDYELLFFFVKNKKYYFEQQKEPTITKDTSKRDRDNTKLNNTPGRTKMNGLKENNYDFKNKRAVWEITTKGFSEAHFAVYPEKLCITPIKAGCPKNGIVLDPFAGAFTTAVVAKQLKRNYIMIELNPEYIKIGENRLKKYPKPML